MKRTKLFLTFLLFAGFSSLVQAQTGINYQGLARRASGAPVAEQNIKIKLSIRDASVSGTVVYTETRSTATNKFGLFNLVIGSTGAASQNGTLAGVNWASGAKFLQVELDPDGGNNFVDMGTTQLQAVPYALFASAATPGGTAAGDLSGTYPNPAVAKLQGKAVSATAPTANQILKYNGTAWAPAVASPDGTAAGDLSGTYPNPAVAKLQGKAVSTTAPTANQILKFDGTTWAPAVASPDGTAAGDLSGTYPNPAVAKIQGKAVSATAPTANQILKFDGTAWAPANEGGLSVGAVATTATANAASVTNGVLNLAPADASNAGIVSTGTQSFAGAKTFSSGLTVTTKPFLPTKLTASQISALTNLEEGMVVYNTDTRKLQLYSVGNSDIVNDLFSGNFTYRKEDITQSFVPPTNGNITAIQVYAKSPNGYPFANMYVDFQDATNNFIGGSNFYINNLSSSGQWYTAELMSPISVTSGNLMRFFIYGGFSLYIGDVVLGTNSNYSNGSAVAGFGGPGSTMNGDDLMFKILVTPTNGTNAYWLNLN
jgi:hypothetical protein